MIYPDTFDNDRRFIFNNWSNEDFKCQWGGIEYIVKKGETKEYPMALAYHMTKHFVNKEMFKLKGEVNIEIEELRKPYEVKTLAEITGDLDSPALTALKEKIEAEVVENQKNGKIKKAKIQKEEVTENLKEFADIK